MPTLLILGGTTEAGLLARAVARAGLTAIFSYAGRVDNPRPQPVPVRVGGFGGVAGLESYLRDHAITHVVDATHPFSVAMSRNAAAACAGCGVPLAVLGRPAWTRQPGDRWTEVGDVAEAAAALAGPPRRVMLGIGRMHLADFATQPQHHYLLRLVDPPAQPPLPDCAVVVARGPFSLAGDTVLLRDHRIDLVVSKNSGGEGARAKIDAARALGLPVVMIRRPDPAAPRVFERPGQVLDWLAHPGADLGV